MAPAHDRHLGYVFQDSRLFPHLSVEGNLRFAAKRAERRRAGWLARARSAKGNVGDIRMSTVVRALDLDSLLGRAPASLSGGEQQRVAMGRALLTAPRVMLMDEPLSSLDLRRKSEIIPYIERLAGEFGVPVLYVTHNVDEVARLASCMVLLADGRLAARGGVAGVLERVDLWPLTGRLEAGSLLQAVAGRRVTA